MSDLAIDTVKQQSGAQVVPLATCTSLAWRCYRYQENISLIKYHLLVILFDVQFYGY